jgi:glucose-6-phosphate isomerase
MVVDLSKQSGLPISLDLETGELHSTGDVGLGDRGERRLSQLREVLADPEAAAADRVCYRTYRGVGTKADLELLEQHSLRYDLTVILPGVIGREFMKTAGHRHSRELDGSVYPEVYEVVHGRATFVTHTERFSGARGSRVQVCELHDRIIIPFDHGHVTANIGNDPLVVCDLIASSSANDYDFYRSKQGLAFYIMEAPGGFRIELNHRYPHPGTLLPEIGVGSRWPEELPAGAPLIELFRRNPNAFDFLAKTKIRGITFED